MTARLPRSQSEIRSASALGSDPYCQLARQKQLDEELEAIRARSRSIWSRPDTSLTTHGHYFADPEQNERTQARPTSAGRHHNPHPKLVFMRTGMREIPNAYGAPPVRFTFRERAVPQKPLVPEYFKELQNLTPLEKQGVDAFLKVANEDSKMNVVQAVKQYRAFMANDYECPPHGVSTVCRDDGSRTEYYPSLEKFRETTKNETEANAITKAMENPDTEIKVVSTEPPAQLKSAGTRNNRLLNRAQTHYQRTHHSHPKCPWPIARRPYRGDFSIHYDWHPRLPHHRLPCLC